MEQETGIKEVVHGNEEKGIKEEVFTKVVRAGKRTYFFDVKATRKEDYYLTITESKKHLGKEGKIYYEKHKIFLYKEDFDKFTEGLRDAVDYIGNGFNGRDDSYREQDAADNGDEPELISQEFTNVDFDDLGKR
ncbi:MAG: DUF3276 family protein [Bacteroidales bacterium]|jgi:hypothetical protein|nr:DUF3276 family protein [Bacteroidales bacterium]